MRPVWVIVVGAGSGNRFGGPKQYQRLGDRRVIDHAVDQALACGDGVVAVVHPDDVDEQRELLDATAVVAGGASRSASVLAGLAAVPDEAAVILVHDAARPLAGAALFRTVIAAVAAGADGVVPVVPVTDTIRRVDGGTVDRSTLVAVQTPQGFRADVLRSAHAAGAQATDDATLVEAAGGSVTTVEGHPANLKITEPADLLVAEALLEGHR